MTSRISFAEDNQYLEFLGEETFYGALFARFDLMSAPGIIWEIFGQFIHPHRLWCIISQTRLRGRPGETLLLGHVGIRALLSDPGGTRHIREVPKLRLLQPVQKLHGVAEGLIIGHPLNGQHTLLNLCSTIWQAGSGLLVNSTSLAMRHRFRGSSESGSNQFSGRYSRRSRSVSPTEEAHSDGTPEIVHTNAAGLRPPFTPTADINDTHSAKEIPHSQSAENS